MKPRFSLKDLLISTTIIAVGLFLFAAHWDWAVNRNLKGQPPIGNNALLSLYLWLGSGAIIGVGVLYLFKKPWLCVLGALIGVVAQFVSLILIMRMIGME